MKMAANSTLEAVRQVLPDVLYVPEAFDVPAQGWERWSAALVADAEQITEVSIAGQLTTLAGPAWAYGIALRQLLTGELATPEARVVLEKFTAGQPLYIGVWESVERFTSFIPVLRYVGGTAYQVGGTKGISLTAATHGEALDQAGDWFIKARERELVARKGHAQKLKLSTLALRILATIIQQDVLYDSEGTPLAWKNLVHGRYGAQGPNWCHLFTGAPETAVRLGYLGLAAARKVTPHLEWDVSGWIGRVPELLGLGSWYIEGGECQGDIPDGWRIARNGHDFWELWWRDKKMAWVSHDPAIDYLSINGKPQPLPAWGLTTVDVLAWVWMTLQDQHRR